MRVQGVVLTGFIAAIGIMSCSSGEPTGNKGPSLTASTVSASTGSITADGASTATITVQLRNASGSAITSSGGTVLMQSTGGTLSGVTDHQNGSYTATLTAPTATGAGIVTAELNGQALTSSATVSFVAGAVDLTHSTIAAADSVLTADGVASTVVTVRARDAHDNAVTGTLTVTIASTKGTVSSVAAPGGGVYTATLTSPITAATGTVSAQINSQPLTATTSVRFAPGAVSLSHSTVTVADSVITADGASVTTVTVRALDSHDNPVTGSIGPVTVAATSGAAGAVTNAGNGVYTATLTSSVIAGVATVSAKINAQSLTGTANVRYAPGPVSLSHSTISVADSVITANGTSSTVVTVRAKDVHDNAITTALGVTIASTGGSMGSVSSAGGGVYNGTLTSPTIIGVATLSSKITAQSLTGTASVRFAAGAVSLSHSTLTVADSVLVASGSSTTLVTVRAKDVHDNPITTALTVTVLTTAGSVGAVSTGGGGVYSATLTSSTALVTANVTAKINAQALTTTAGVRFKTGPAAQVVLVAGNNQIVPPNKQICDTLLLLVSDGFGHPVQGSAITVAVTTGGGTFLGSTVTSDAQGYATIGTVGAGDWRVGAALGAQTMTASAHLTDAASAVVGTATITAQVSGDGFHYDQVFDGASAQAGVPWNFTSHLQVRIVDDLTSAIVRTMWYEVTDNTGACTWDATTLTCPSPGTFTINFQQQGFDGDDNPSFRPQITLTVTP